MTILLPAMLFIGSGGKMMLGGAKPVPVNPANYRNYKRGDIIVSLAGVFVNLLIAFVSVPLFVVVGLIGRAAPGANPVLGIVQAMLIYSIGLNLLLAGVQSHSDSAARRIARHQAPSAAVVAAQYERFGRYGLLILIVILYAGGGLLTYWLRPAMALQSLLLQWVSPFAVSNLGQWLP